MRLQRLLQKLDPLPRTSIVTGYRGEGRTGLEEALGAKKVVPNRVRNLHISYRLLSSVSPFNRLSQRAIISSYNFYEYGDVNVYSGTFRSDAMRNIKQYFASGRPDNKERDSDGRQDLVNPNKCRYRYLIDLSGQVEQGICHI